MGSGMRGEAGPAAAVEVGPSAWEKGPEVGPAAERGAGIAPGVLGGPLPLSLLSVLLPNAQLMQCVVVGSCKDMLSGLC